ncbi:unnamed protein product [Rotaria sp. Silwood1]|nr:unnamed protein product [Rotaria sp. Silwood1]CAF1182379.1 unnamed protein product [Rotaria sp. Silwood1]
MRAPRIHPYYETVRVSPNHIENHLGCSSTYLLRTRRRRFLFLISILMIILICSLVIPLTIILTRCKKTHQSSTITTDSTLNSTTNTTIFDDSTINIDTSTANTVTDFYFVSNNTLQSGINSSVILINDTIIDTIGTQRTFTLTLDSTISSNPIRRKFNH